MAGKGRQHPAVPAEVRAEDLFSAALGLEAPWRVTGVSFEGEPRRLDIQLAFATGAHFACPECGAQGLGVYDAADRTWRHLLLPAPVPPPYTSSTGAVQGVRGPDRVRPLGTARERLHPPL